MFNEALLTAPQVADLLGLGRNKVYELARTGELGSLHIGRKLRFTEADVRAYLQQGHRDGAKTPVPAAPVRSSTQDGASITRDSQAPADTVADAMAPLSPDAVHQLHAFDLPSSGAQLTVAGTDPACAPLAQAMAQAGFPANRRYQYGFGGLMGLYLGTVDLAAVHLYDLRSNSYNIPFVQRLAPGTSVIVVRLLRRRVGYLVPAGNPKKLATWGNLLHDGVRLANQRAGAALRVLLDQKLISMDARAETITGYQHAVPTPQEAARLVAAGAADVCLADAWLAATAPNLTFVPLQTETLDLVVRKGPDRRSLVRWARNLEAHDTLRQAIATLGPSDTDAFGAVVYEC